MAISPVLETLVVQFLRHAGNDTNIRRPHTNFGSLLMTVRVVGGQVGPLVLSAAFSQERVLIIGLAAQSHIIL